MGLILLIVLFLFLEVYRTGVITNFALRPRTRGCGAAGRCYSDLNRPAGFKGVANMRVRLKQFKT